MNPILLHCWVKVHTVCVCLSESNISRASVSHGPILHNIYSSQAANAAPLLLSHVRHSISLTALGTNNTHTNKYSWTEQAFRDTSPFTSLSASACSSLRHDARRSSHALHNQNISMTISLVFTALSGIKHFPPLSLLTVQSRQVKAILFVERMCSIAI